MDVCATLEKSGYEPESRREMLELAVLSFFAFAIPLLFPGPQLLTGAVVNSFLVFAALRFRGMNVLPLILLPSLGALANGFVFGPFTIFLIYLIPFIWMGNFLLVYGIKKLAFETGINFWVAGGISALAKTTAIFAPACILYAGGFIPQEMLLPMGLIQFATAICGVAAVGVLAKAVR